MAIRSRKIKFKAHPWVYERKKIYWDLKQLNYDVKLVWIPSYVRISSNEVVDGLVRPGSREQNRPRTNIGGH
jgi:hypothetical protein